MSKEIIKPQAKSCHNCQYVEYESCDCSDYGCSHGSYGYCTKDDKGQEMRSDKMISDSYCNKGKKCFQPASEATLKWRRGEFDESDFEDIDQSIEL